MQLTTNEEEIITKVRAASEDAKDNFDVILKAFFMLSEKGKMQLAATAFCLVRDEGGKIGKLI